MSKAAARIRESVVERALNGDGYTSPATRRAAFDDAGVDERARPLIETVARNAWKVTDEHVAAAKRAGLRDDEIFELTVCAALGQATRQLRAALAVVDAADGRAAAVAGDPPNGSGGPR